MKTTKLMYATTALFLLAAGACTDTTAPEAEDDAVLLQAAVVAADATLEDLGLMGLPFGFGPQGLGAGPGGQGMGPGGQGMGPGGQGMGPGGPGMGPGQPGGQQGLGGAFSGTRAVTFFDADGNEQDAYDPLTTERIVASMEVAGDVTRGSWSASVARTREMVITGLSGENTTRVVNGSGSETVSRSRLLEDGATASHDMDGSFTYTDLVVPTPDQEVRYPLSGTITREMTVVVVNGPNGDVTRTVNVTITFDGDETATAVVDGETFEIDLTTRPGGFPLRGGRGRHANG